MSIAFVKAQILGTHIIELDVSKVIIYSYSSCPELIEILSTPVKGKEFQAEAKKASIEEITTKLIS